MELKRIGTIHTPYKNSAPYQPEENVEKEFFLSIDKEYIDGLDELIKFKYVYLLYFLDKLKTDVKIKIVPPWSGDKSVGLFASRSPVRPNPIGLSVVKIKSILGNKVFISGIDAFDGTPLIDIKPYIKGLDSKPDSNTGWVEDPDEIDHLSLHINGIPHEY